MKGRISENDISAIRERINIIDIVSEYVALKKKGKFFWGLCPFHKEKTPSFKVDPASQLYHCFGCGEGGNVYTFIMKMEHLEFPEAVEMLADRIGYTINYETKSFPAASKRSKILEAHRLAALFYQYILLKTKEGSRGLNYIKNRGIAADIVKRFSLGLSAQSWSSLTNYLEKKGFEKDLLVEAGLSIKGQKGYYDRFRGRLMFPICDMRGQVIAFGGRVIDKGEPKYLNSPETSIYHKSSTLYGMHLAKNAIVREGFVIVVEGYTDVLALSQAGIENVVATLGTAFTSEHIELLKRFTNKIILIFDADAAGIKAAESASSFMSDFRLPRMESLQDIERNSDYSLDVRVIILPDNQDPAEYIATRGSDELRKILVNAEPFFDFYLTRELNKYNIIEIRQKERAAVAGLKLIATLDNPALQKEYISIVAQRLGLDEEALTVKFNAMQNRNARVRSFVKTTTLDPQEKAERSFLHLLLKYPEMRNKIPADFSEEYFAYPAHARLFTVLKVMGEGKFDASILDRIDEDLKPKATELYLSEVECEEENLSKYFQEYLNYIKDFYFKRLIDKLKKQLQQEMKEQNSENYDLLFEELLTIEAKRRELRQKSVD